MVAGHTGEGKSTTIGRMVRAVMTGGEFLGWHGAGCGAKVLYIDLEQDQTIAQRRIVETWYGAKWDESLTVPQMIGDKLAPELSDSYYARWSEGLALNTLEIDKVVVEERIAMIEPDLVVVDPLYKAFDGDPNDQQLATAVMRILDGWRETYGFGLLIGAHMRKPNRQGATFNKHDVSASGAWIFGAEVVLGIKRLQGNGAALHFFKDRAGDLPTNDHWTLDYSVDKGYKRSAIDADGSGGTLPAVERIWRLLQDVNGRLVSRSEIAEYLHIPASTVRKATDELAERLEDGKLDGLVVEKTSSSNLYGYRPTEERLTLERIKAALDAEEEGV